MARVQLSHVSKRFADSVAVDSLDLQLESGSLSTLLGPSGCGKTTTLRLIAGLEHPTSGRIEIGDTCVFDDQQLVPAEHRGIGMVFQSYAVWPHLRVFENVAYPLRVRRLPAREIRARVETALQRVELTHLRDRWPAQLSGGQQQRVALARAIVAEPKLLLLDEPLSNLDAQLREQLGNEIRQLQKQLGLTAVYVTHDQKEALALSDFIAVMDRGRVVQRGSARELYERPNSRFVAEFLGWTNFLPVDTVTRDCVELFGVKMSCHPTKLAQGKSAFAAIRPDRVTLTVISARDDAGSHLVGRVTRLTYHGAYCVCELSLHGQALLAWTPPEATPEIDSIVRISFAPSSLRVVTD